MTDTEKQTNTSTDTGRRKNTSRALVSSTRASSMAAGKSQGSPTSSTDSSPTSDTFSTHSAESFLTKGDLSSKLLFWDSTHSALPHSDGSNGEAATPVHATWKPNSKTSLGRIHHELKSLPSLLIYEVEVTTLGRVEPTKVESRKLRTEALREFGSHLEELPGIDIVVYNVDTRARQLDSITVSSTSSEESKADRTNHLIIPVAKDQAVSGIEDLLSSTHRERRVEAVKKPNRQQNDQGHKEQRISCRIIGEGKLLQPENTERKNEVEQQGLFKPGSATFNDTSLFEPRIRRTLALAKTTDGYDILLDFDLVPTIKKDIPVSDLVKSYFPPNIAHQVPDLDCKLKKLLNGIRVTYPQVSVAEKDETDSGTGAEKGKNIDQGTQRKAAPIYTIKDVKPNSEVGSIVRAPASDTSDVALSKKYYTVRQHMRQIHGEGVLDNALNYLPLADIGNKHPFWVPMEFLKVAQGQIPRQAGHLTTELKQIRESVASVLRGPSGLLLKLENVFFNNVNEHCKRPIFEMKSSAFYPPFAEKTAYVPSLGTPVKPVPLTREWDQDRPKYRVAVIFVGPTEELKDGTLARAIRQGFNSSGQGVLQIDEHRVEFASVSSLQELIRYQKLTAEEVSKQKLIDLDNIAKPEGPTNETPNSTANGSEDLLILGVIEGSAFDRMKYREIDTEMKRLGDRRVGAITICTEKAKLTQLLRPRNGGSVKFPSNILRKAKLMGGGKNWEPRDLSEHKLLSEKASRPLIVVGAHISHPPSSSTEKCPSAVSVVIGQERVPVHYLGTSRWQPTQYLTQDNVTKKLVLMTEPEIHTLEEIMRDRFTLWKSKVGQVKNTVLPNVVFYRDAYSPIDKHTCTNEIDKIQKAYRTVWGKGLGEGDIKLAYIVVTKNTWKHTTAKDAKSDIPVAPPFTFTTYQYKEGENVNRRNEEDAAKYQYHVPHLKIENIRGNDLKDLTALLNINSQLSSVTSIALPVHFARKLGRRVLDSYDCFSRKDNNSYPGVAQLTNFGEHVSMGIVTATTSYLKKSSDDKPSSAQVDRSELCNALPWHNKLDDKMFYL